MKTNSEFMASFYFDVVHARAYVLALNKIVKENNTKCLTQISFSALIEALIVTVCRMYDKNSKVGSIVKVMEADAKNDFKIDSDLRKKYEGLPKINDAIKIYRDTIIAHKDKGFLQNYEELKKCHLLDKVEPFIEFAEELYDKTGNKYLRNKNIDEIEQRLKDE